MLVQHTSKQTLNESTDIETQSSRDGTSSPDASSVYIKILLTWVLRMRSLTFARALDDAINQEARGASTAGSSFYKRVRYRHPANSVYALNHEPTIPDVISNTRC